MNLIVAVDANWAIGKGGDQLVYIPEDLKHFKELTMGHPVILGRKTMATFPGGRPLKGRRNLVVSRNPDFRPEGAEVYPDMDALLAAAVEQGTLTRDAITAAVQVDNFYCTAEGDVFWLQGGALPAMNSPLSAVLTYGAMKDVSVNG